MEKIFCDISGELKILTENTEKSVKTQEVKVVPNITNNIVRGDINTWRIHIDDLNQVQYEEEGKYQ